MNESVDWQRLTNGTTLAPRMVAASSEPCLIEPFLCRSNTVLFRTVATIFGSILIFLIVLLNAPLVYAILKLSRRRLKPAHVTVLSVAAADLFTACVYLPVLIVVLQKDKERGCRGLCTALVTLEKGSIAVTVWSAAFISVDRYLLVVKHAAYSSKMNVTKATVGVSMLWVGGIIFSAMSFYLVSSTQLRSGECVCHLTSANYGLFSMVFTAGFIVFCSFLPIIIMVTLYGFMLRMTYVTTSRHVGPGSVDDALRTSEALHQREPPRLPIYERQMLQLTVLLLSLFVVLTSPYFVITLVVSMGHWEPHSHPYFLHVISVLLFHANSTCNALFYGYGNRRLRDAVFDHLAAVLPTKRGEPTEFPPMQQLSISELAGAGDGSRPAPGRRRSRSSSSSSLGGLSAASREAFAFRDSLDASHARRYKPSGASSSTDLVPSSPQANADDQVGCYCYSPAQNDTAQTTSNY